ncbi:VOC family protein [Brachybacterium phenoliresistens]|uniref:3-demethylubiquinone-9 3-methyltransferase n=1 Tax=Brachybacterium phenoliresistens TaxID=396014 RepID=Z9JR04_9MICO|nr:VOC family protein [Brachybacterium phenoliresistens]EWS80177.1 3-demethylubiquinone-9 3-methyltransferase [Brachybacterium phenoliresistens]
MTRVKTWLWFDGGVDEAAEFYVSLIPGSRIVSTMPYTPVEDSPGGAPPEGQSLAVEIELAGVPYALLNGGPHFPQSEAVSIEVAVDSQEEIDRLWDAIVGGGGQESQCGWCKDRWGVSWQITPQRLYELLEGPHAAAVTAEMFTQRKLDIARLEAAAGV